MDSSPVIPLVPGRSPRPHFATASAKKKLSKAFLFFPAENVAAAAPPYNHTTLKLQL